MDIWKILSGKKRNIALAYWLIVVPTIQFWPDSFPVLSEWVGDLCTLIGIIMSGFGLTHAYIKYKQNGVVVEEPKEVVK